MTTSAGHLAKVLTRDRLVAQLGRPREERLVFTNGCFDLIHPGHVAYLEAARALGDRLVVGVNTDASVRRLKGPSRPMVDEEARLRVLAGLASVDAVTLFDEDTPAELIAALRPDVLVKGGDYTPERIVGRDLVVADGGEVAVIPFLPGYSTTALVRRIIERNEDS
ncbi:D-glycero-beta-D-manno-heptose 1-phosphate adenylyltransferase [Gaopeijia maritima]|uniref:D-glycero-beta-D-manno-heptose 1-phosphate adenylyltransferase n=1 Tax=Gaopeijia maritima TaxID=3119007 RepID=A0ABU9E986_9BACT